MLVYLGSGAPLPSPPRGKGMNILNSFRGNLKIGLKKSEKCVDKGPYHDRVVMIMKRLRVIDISPNNQIVKSVQHIYLYMYTENIRHIFVRI